MQGAGEDVELTTGLNRAIRWHRRSLDLSQAEFGKKVGATLNTVLSWEKGRTKPTIDQLMMMSQIFGVQEQELLHPPVGKREFVDMS